MLTHSMRRGWMVVVVVFLYAPLVIMVLFSFNAARLSFEFEGFTLDWYGKLLRNREVLESTWASLVVAVVATLLSTVIGTAAAIGLRHERTRRWNTVARIVIYIPLFIPDIILGISLLSVFVLVHMTLGHSSVIVAHTTFNISFVFVIVAVQANQLGPHGEEAAMNLGATPFRALCTVTLPQLVPSIAAAALVAFTLSLGDVVVAFFTCGIGATTLPVKILSMLRFGVTPEINALSSALLLVAIIVMLVALRIHRRFLVERPTG